MLACRNAFVVFLAVLPLQSGALRALFGVFDMLAALDVLTCAPLHASQAGRSLSSLSSA